MVFDGARGRAYRSGKWKLCLCPGSGSPGAYGNRPKSDEAWRAAVEAAGKAKSMRDLATAPFVQFALFDAPTREECVVRRDRTNTPLQALSGLNDPAFWEASLAVCRSRIQQYDELAAQLG